MRVEKVIASLTEARDFARDELDPFLPADWRDDERIGYWESCEIAYYPDYAGWHLVCFLRIVRRRSHRSVLRGVKPFSPATACEIRAKLS